MHDHHDHKGPALIKIAGLDGLEIRQPSIQQAKPAPKPHDHNTMGVQLRHAPNYTHFDVPAGMETGASTLVVVTNGIASNPVSITVN